MQLNAQSTLRELLASNLGAELTPELAARIEAAAGFCGEPLDPVEPEACGSLVFRSVRHADIEHQAEFLQQSFIAEHPGEIAPIDHAEIRRREGRGVMVTFAAFRGSDVVGIARMHIGRTDIYSDEISATDDIVYVRPEFRAGRSVLRFGEYIENGIRQMGATRLRIHAARRHGLTPMLIRQGYEHTHDVLNKRLG